MSFHFGDSSARSSYVIGDVGETLMEGGLPCPAVPGGSNTPTEILPWKLPTLHPVQQIEVTHLVVPCGTDVHSVVQVVVHGAPEVEVSLDHGKYNIVCALFPFDCG